MASKFTQFVTARMRRRAWEILKAQFAKSGEGWPYASGSKSNAKVGMGTKFVDYFQLLRELPAGLPVVGATVPSQDDLKRWVKSFEKVLADNPGASLAAAFVLGSSFGWWVKRR